MVKSNNCIRLKKGEKCPHDGVLYTNAYHEHVEYVFSGEPIRKAIKKVVGDNSPKNTSFEKGKDSQSVRGTI